MASRSKTLAPARVASKRQINLTINRQRYKIEIGKGSGKAEPTDTLAFVLRNTLGLTGTKVSCDSGACAGCTIIMDGKAVLSCMTLAVECEGKEIITIEGLRDSKTGDLDPLQQSFIDHTAFQCGFCTPGMLMGAKALLVENPSPAEEEVREALSGHFCRCISFYQVIRAVLDAAGRGR